MGKAIEKLAVGKGHEIVLRVSSGNAGDLTEANLRKADVAFEFSRREVAFHQVAACLRAGVPVVSGTTAWLDQLEEARSLCITQNGAFFYTSNFSIGVNIFFAVNRYLAEMMDARPQYELEMEEIHHTQKLDYPSGTAITLAQDILQNVSRKKSWVARLEKGENAPATLEPDQFEILSKRVEDMAGKHLVSWSSAIDTIQISHTAFSREGFAAGAIAAGEWLPGKSGCFGMKDMLGF